MLARVVLQPAFAPGSSQGFRVLGFRGLEFRAYGKP